MHHFKLNQAITQNRGSAALNLVLSTKKKNYNALNQHANEMKAKMSFYFEASFYWFKTAFLKLFSVRAPFKSA